MKTYTVELRLTITSDLEIDELYTQVKDRIDPATLSDYTQKGIGYSICEVKEIELERIFAKKE